MRKIEYLNVAVSELRKNPWNTNKVSPENELKIRESLNRNGMFKPIVVREVAGVPGYEILGGEHRWEQAIELGESEVPVANLGVIPDKQAKEIGLIDNARYGSDDTLGLSDLLKEIGDVPELQSFLPYGQADIDAIFSASVIALDDLGIDENFEKTPEPVEDETPLPKVAKTHSQIRVKVTIADAERLTALIAKTQKDHGYTTEDDLTNAGDALVHLLGDHLKHLAGASGYKDDELDAELDEALANPEAL
ncbi:ParB N-terminal domain-containing protein [Ensifer sp. ENS10]|uniref:ParB/RepB/Spo0J family partition protein n=1 Tax=Ensifer sp. ENS10 TaxID=2769286 RepID=UPI0017835C73|nr:ParB/RepB/Spo0J family partition protein [Ensifer sp. ENS10]MBD9511612.1 ParB N-terminal domain-containing protein [Ensifer sp. ENS10]